MAIDPSVDPLIPLSKAAKSLPKPPSLACLWRWHAKGVRGVHLETVVVGGRRYTTAAAWREFVAKLTENAAADSRPAVVPPRSEELTKRLRAERLV
jgi:hypothetical protein